MTLDEKIKKLEQLILIFKKQEELMERIIKNIKNIKDE